MDPDEIEFIGEKLSIGIIPNFNFDAIHLIQSTIGIILQCLHLLKFNFFRFKVHSELVCQCMFRYG